MSIPSVEEAIAIASKAAFGSPLVMNVHRALIVEAIVSAALPNGWTWCSSDYAPWDFIHDDGVRLEVKQSAARQSWATLSKPPTKARWDISPRTGFWKDGKTWVPGPGRNAEIYVLAHHPLLSDGADHRNARQWQFYVLAAVALPEAKSVSMKRVAALCESVPFDGLGERVESLRQSVLSA